MEEEAAVVEPPRFHFRGGSRLRVFRFGDGRRGAVVFLHGLLSSHRFWEDIARGVAAQGFACYAPDLLGFGESPWPRGEASYAISEHVGAVARDVLAAVERDFGGDLKPPVHVVGHSLGAVVATELAAREKVVASLVTVSLPYYRSQNAARRDARDSCCCCGRKHKSWRGGAVWLVLACPLLAYLLCSLICQQRWFYVMLGRLVDRAARTLLGRRPSFEARFADALNHSYDSVVASYRQCVETHRLDPANLDLPVLVAHGRDDDVVDPACSRDFHADLVDARVDATLVLIDGVNHSCNDNNLAALLGRWFAKDNISSSSSSSTTTTLV
ncbi:hypothetical protein CTAYLR_002653 [Chrysophaeum taylorii]|uniref:Serine aminopeptidase S33 domain-containing protein n=1 Tax=Chrysophaeum taylorii TaxID=2483200 RepID=A0AAD7UBP1_9STRA|nr:hypothetical protein CTAYLR_002653 [Chrysophaeum taylorii]